MNDPLSKTLHRSRAGRDRRRLDAVGVLTGIGSFRLRDARAFRWLLTPHGENDKYARQIRTSAGVAVFTARSADKAGWVKVGRCYERFALQATALGGQHPDLVVRFERRPALPPSLRRAVRDVLG